MEQGEEDWSGAKKADNEQKVLIIEWNIIRLSIFIGFNFFVFSCLVFVSCLFACWIELLTDNISSKEHWTWSDLEKERISKLRLLWDKKISRTNYFEKLIFQLCMNGIMWFSHHSLFCYLKRVRAFWCRNTVRVVRGFGGLIDSVGWYVKWYFSCNFSHPTLILVEQVWWRNHHPKNIG